MSSSEHEPEPARSLSPPIPSLKEPLLILGGLAGLFFVVFAWVFFVPAGPGPGTVVVGEPIGGGLVAGDIYAGSESCRECHPGAFALHARSGHARTLRPAADRALARRLDGQSVQDPEWENVRWTYRHRDGQLFVERTEGATTTSLPIDFAFGSGHHATTFLTLQNDPESGALEHRITYFAEGTRLGITPGQAGHLPQGTIVPHGRLWTPEETAQCFLCHATRLSATDERRIDTETLIPTVSCERCHGPAREHVEKTRRGERDRSLTDAIVHLTADQEMLFCGQCHRHPSTADPKKIVPDNPELARYQPVGLMQSACYVKSRGALRCVTCHDPHARTETDSAIYEATCLQCHQGPGHAECPISPEDGCVDCHMPRVDSGQEILFTDHWIRVWRDPPSSEPAGSASAIEPARTRPHPTASESTESRGRRREEISQSRRGAGFLAKE